MFQNLSKSFWFVLVLLISTYSLTYFISYKTPGYIDNRFEKTSFTIFQSWDNAGIMKKRAIPTILNIDSTFQSIAHFKTKNNTAYFVSHPPFSYYLGYLYYLIFGENWILINFLLPFISAFLIYATVCVLCFHHLRNGFYLPAFFAFLIYILHPVVAKFQMFIFHPDTVVQTIFIGLTYTALKMIMRRKETSWKYMISFGILSFLMAYTSWIGVLFSITICVYGLFNLRKGYHFTHIIFISLFTLSFALWLVLWQYSSVDGLSSYISFLKDAYIEESQVKSIGFSVFKNPISVIYILKYYFKAYWVIYLSILIFILFSITGKQKRIVFTKNGYRYILFSMVPVMMSHFVLPHYSVSLEFSLLYALGFLSVMMGILFEKVRKTEMFEPYVLYIFGALICIGVYVQ